MKIKEFNSVDIITNNEEVKKDSVYKGLTDYKPCYSHFDQKFLKHNLLCTKEDSEYIYASKRGIKYIAFDKAENYKIPKGKCIGQIIPRKRKTYTHQEIAYITINKKHIRVYADLKTTPIGVIPISNERYILVTRPKIDIATILTPLLFTYFMFKSFIG